MTELWRQCVACFRAAEDDDGTKLRRTMFTINCFSNHNRTVIETTDGAPPEEEDDNIRYRRTLAPDLLQHDPPSGVRQRPESCESLRSESSGGGEMVTLTADVHTA